MEDDHEVDSNEEEQFRVTPAEINLNEKVNEEKDPALIQYMLSLGIDPNYVPPEGDPRRVVVAEFAIVFKDHPTPAVLVFDTEDDIQRAKEHPLVIKEGSLYKMRVTFRVQHTIVLGFKIINQIYSKIGARLAKDTEMLGSYPPSNDFKAVLVPSNDDNWHEAPKGMLARGEYKAIMKFEDDDKICHFELEYRMKIAKEFQDDE